MSEYFIQPSFLHRPWSKNSNCQISIEINVEEKARATIISGLHSESAGEVKKSYHEPLKTALWCPTSTMCMFMPMLMLHAHAHAAWGMLMPTQHVHAACLPTVAFWTSAGFVRGMLTKPLTTLPHRWWPISRKWWPTSQGPPWRRPASVSGWASSRGRGEGAIFFSKVISHIPVNNL